MLRLSLFLLCTFIAGPHAFAGPLTTRNNKCLDVKDGKFANGAQIQLWDCVPGSSNQQWNFSGGQLKGPSGKCLDIKDGVVANGRALQLWDCWPGSDNQAWQFVNGQIKHASSNYCVDVTDGLFSNGTLLQLWQCAPGSANQTWSTNGSSPAQASSTSNSSNYLRIDGTRIVDKNNNLVRLRGTNIGGWLVTEGWMCGMSDSSDKDPFRFGLETLERRFGAQTADQLINVWRDNFFTSADLDNIKSYGINAIRIPFGYRNLQRADGSWIKNSSGNIDFSRLDWVVGEAAKRGIYSILDFHIWEGQQANYSLISENSDGGRAAQAKAAAIWVQVAKHFKGNPWVAGFDAINEPTGSYANLMQDALYKAIRSVDTDRIIFMESMSADPASLKWQNVSYSLHQYNMMGNDYNANKSALYSDINGTIAMFGKFNIPTYIGEFMVQKEGDMLPWLLQQYASNGLHYTNWAYKTIDMGAWGLCNLSGNSRVDLINDSAATIRNKWQNLGACTPEAKVVAAFRNALK